MSDWAAWFLLQEVFTGLGKPPPGAVKLLSCLISRCHSISGFPSAIPVFGLLLLYLDFHFYISNPLTPASLVTCANEVLECSPQPTCLVAKPGTSLSPASRLRLCAAAAHSCGAGLVLCSPHIPAALRPRRGRIRCTNPRWPCTWPPPGSCWPEPIEFPDWN